MACDGLAQLVSAGAGHPRKASIRVVACHGNEGECGRGVDLIHNSELLLLFSALDGSRVWGLIDAEGVDPEIAPTKSTCDGDGVFDRVGKRLAIQSICGRHDAAPHIAEGKVVAPVRIGDDFTVNDIDHTREGQFR